MHEPLLGQQDLLSQPPQLRQHDAETFVDYVDRQQFARGRASGPAARRGVEAAWLEPRLPESTQYPKARYRENFHKD